MYNVLRFKYLKYKTKEKLKQKNRKKKYPQSLALRDSNMSSIFATDLKINIHSYRQELDHSRQKSSSQLVQMVQLRKIFFI